MRELHELPVMWFERVWNQQDENAIDELLAPNFVAYGLGEKMTSPDDFKVFYRKFREAFPDLRVKTEKVVAEGDWAVVRIVAEGSHAGDFEGLAATNSPIHVDGMVMTRWHNGQIVEAYNSIDMLTLLKQIGAL